MIKTITKHAMRSKRIPILGMIRVVDGVMQTTDMDFWVSGPTTLPDGMYHRHGFDKGVQIKSELPVSDFPEPQGFKKDGEIASTVIDKASAAALEWALKAASNESARYYLCGVYFDWREPQAVVVATDGHRLHTFNHEVSATRPKKVRKKQADGKFKMIAPEAGAILPKAAVKIILDLMKEQGTDKAEIDFQGTNFRAIVGAASVAGKLVDGTFPDWRLVVPECPVENTTLFDPQQIKALIQELSVLTKIGIGAATKPCLKIKGGIAQPNYLTKDIKREWPVSLNFPFEAGFNAKYLSELCGGVMYFKTPDAPFKVVDRRGRIERMAVIMPIRV